MEPRRRGKVQVARESARKLQRTARLVSQSKPLPPYLRRWLSTAIEPIESDETEARKREQRQIQSLRGDQDQLLEGIQQAGGEPIVPWPPRNKRGPSSPNDLARLRSMNAWLGAELSRRRGQPVFPPGSGWESLEHGGVVSAPRDLRVNVQSIGRPAGKSAEAQVLLWESLVEGALVSRGEKASRKLVRLTAIEIVERLTGRSLGRANIWAMGRKR